MIDALQKQIPNARLGFREGTSLLDIVGRDLSEQDICQALYVLQSLGYLGFKIENRDAFIHSMKSQLRVQGQSLAVLGYITFWVETLAWVSYLSSKEMTQDQLILLKTLSLLLYLFILRIAGVKLIKSGMNSTINRVFHVDTVISLGLLCTLILALLGFNLEDMSEFYLDSSSLSLFIVLFSRYRSTSDRLKKTISEMKVPTHTDLPAKASPLEMNLQRIMSRIMIVSTSCLLLVILFQSKQMSRSKLTTIFLIAPSIVCPCLLWAFVERNQRSHLAPSVKRFTLAASAALVAFYNFAGIGLWASNHLLPQTLSVAMLGVVLGLLLINSSLAFWKIE